MGTNNQNKLKQFTKKNKKWLLLGSCAVASLAVPLTIYFTQTLYFYNMEPISQQQGNNVNTLYSHDSFIETKYKRNPAAIMTSYVDKNGANHDITKYKLEDYPYPENTAFPKREDRKQMIKNHMNDASIYMDGQLCHQLAETNSLKKHPAADYQYGYDWRLPDSAPAVKKVFNFDLTQPGMFTTGLYLAPGEVLTIHFKNKTDQEIANLNLTVYLGASDWSIANAGKEEKTLKRMPNMRTQIKITKNDFKFGSPFGGIVNIDNGSNVNNSEVKNVALSIDGAAEALHYIHGQTTLEEWTRLVNESKAPTFDISSDHLKFMGPVNHLTNFRLYHESLNKPNDDKNNQEEIPKEEIKIDDPKYYPFKSMDLLDKIALDSLYTINDNNKKLPPIRTSFTNFVPAGEAVSFVRAFFVIAPPYWADYIIDYDWLVNKGYWGIMHENNHQNQSGVWGYHGHGEVTNNVLTLISYMKYTNIWNDRDGLKDKITLHEAKNNGHGAQERINREFAVTSKKPANGSTRGGFDSDYGIVMAQFGPDKLQEIIRSYSTENVLDYYGNPLVVPDAIEKVETNASSQTKSNKRNARFVYRISALTGYDFSQHSFNTFLITKEDAQIIHNDLKAKGFKKYVPGFSFYASQSNYDNQGYIDCARPFLIKEKYFKDGFDFDLSPNSYNNTNNYLNTGGLTTTASFDKKLQYKLENIKITKEPTNGKWQDLGNNKYKYIPNTSNLNQKDYFEYSVDVSEVLNDVEKIGEVQSEPINVKFRVELELEGNTNEFVVDGNYQYEQFYNENEIPAKKEDIASISMDEFTPKGTTEPFDIISKIDAKKWFETKNKTANATITINLNKPIDLNYLAIAPQQSDGISTPDGLIIKANGKEVYNGSFLKERESIHEFANQHSVTKIELTFRSFNRVEDPNGDTDGDGTTDFNEVDDPQIIKINSIRYGIKSKPNQVLTPDSDWIYTVGDWRSGNGDGKVNSSSLFTILPGAKAQFGFQGDSFTIVGTKDQNYGSFDVYIDGKKYRTVKTDSESRKANQPLLIVTNLDPNIDHSITILTKESKPIDIQYISLFGVAKPINVNDWFYFLAVGIPIIIILIIALAIMVWLYVMAKKGKKISFEKFSSKFKSKDNNDNSNNKQVVSNNEDKKPSKETKKGKQ